MIWAFVSIAIAILLIVLEAFLPSHGLLGFLSAVAVVVSLVLGFSHGPVTGMAVLVVAAVAMPVSIAFMIQIWPHTPIGRRMLIPPVQNPDDVLPDTEAQRLVQKSLGKQGLAKSLMLPGGIVEIEGRAFDAISEGLAIEPGTRVLVIAVSSNRLVVRPLAGAELSGPAPNASEQELLAQPIDRLGLDPFQDPLA